MLKNSVTQVTDFLLKKPLLSSVNRCMFQTISKDIPNQTSYKSIDDGVLIAWAVLRRDTACATFTNGNKPKRFFTATRGCGTEQISQNICQQTWDFSPTEHWDSQSLWVRFSVVDNFTFHPKWSCLPRKNSIVCYVPAVKRDRHV